MGADFRLYGLPACTITPERRVLLEHLIENTTEEDLRDDFLAEYKGDTLDEYRGRLRVAVAWYEEWAHKSRETTYRSLEGMPYGLYLTGGLSWGDPPTEAAEHFNLLTPHLEIWKHLRAWAIEDAQKEEKAYDIDAPIPEYLVVGIFADSHQRYAEWIRAKDPVRAEKAARLQVKRHTGADLLLVAGVVTSDAEMALHDHSTYAQEVEL
jgi:hypothetical protein